MVAIAGSGGTSATFEDMAVMAAALDHRERGRPEHRSHVLYDLATPRGPWRAGLWGGWQSPDRRVVVTVDAAIENRRALVARCGRNHTADVLDEALIADLYQRFGLDGFRYIDGPFAIALVDLANRQVVLARDYLGIKPLHFAHQRAVAAGDDSSRTAVHFASEIHALLKNPKVVRKPNFAAIAEQLCHFHLSTNATFFADVHAVRPGHALAIDPDSGLTESRFRGLRFTSDGPASEHEAIESFSEVLRNAVVSRAAKHQTIDVALSGGIDSAVVAAIAAEHAGPDRVRTFALANDFDYTTVWGGHGSSPATLPSGERCEAVRARFLASWLGVAYDERRVGGADVLAAIPQIVQRFAAPHTSSFAPFLLAQHVEGETSQMLSGLGADELLRGYHRSQHMADGQASEGASAIAQGYFSLDRHLNHDDRCALLQAEVLDQINLDQVSPHTIDELLRAAPQTSLPDLGLYLDFEVQMANELLPTTDLSFAVHSITATLPFLDSALVDLVLSLPPSLRSQAPRPKHLLRQAAAPLLPGGYLDLPKTGFSLPIERWVDGPLQPWISDMLAPDALRARGWFQPNAVEAIRRRHQRQIERRSEVLWTLAMIEMWARTHLDCKVDSNAHSPIKLGPAVVRVNASIGTEHCTKKPACLERHMGQHRPLLGDYVSTEVPFEGQRVAAWLDLRDLDYDSYETAVRRTHKGAGLRQAAKADRAGFWCERFAYDLFVPDIAEINTSKEERSAGPMTAPYRRSVDELGGAPTELSRVDDQLCPIHRDTWWGLFADAPGHRQGAVRVDRRLLAYIRIRRHGNYALVSKILGHGDHLSTGVVYRLFLAVIRWLCERDEPETKGIEHLVYANYDQLPKGLLQWKQRMQFRPALLTEAPTQRMRALARANPTSDANPAVVSLGENCLTHEVLQRHGLSPIVTPFAHSRSNLDYALQLEERGYDSLLDRRFLALHETGERAQPIVVRSTAVAECDPLFHPLHTAGFELTHHNVIEEPEARASVARKIDRLHDLRRRRDLWFFYHYRLHPEADLDSLAAKADRFLQFYNSANSAARFVIFEQELVERSAQRGLDQIHLSEHVTSFNFRTLAPWAGDNNDDFWALRDDDLFSAMFQRLGFATPST